MKKKAVKVTVCVLTGALSFGAVPFSASAAPTAGVTGYTTEIMTSSSLPTAGVSLAFTECMVSSKGDAVMESAQPEAEVAENETPVVKSEYADIAVAQVTSYVNVRSIPGEDGEILGKLYNNSAATVLETSGDWYKISSGSVTGYVKSEFVVVGDEELSKSVGRRVATVDTETLKVRKEASTESGVLGLVPGGDDLTVIDESVDGWVGVAVAEGQGYVSSEYVKLSTVYTYAESKEEEEARLKKEEEEREMAAAAAAAARKTSSSSSYSSDSGSSSQRSYSAPSGSNGQAVANYACQFVGNPYVYGGTSLTNGTDCSGFVMSVYKQFGISLPHSSAALRSVGYGVSASEMQPGDIVCYSGHVAIYVGNNTIVHAATERTGIKYTSPANYTTILAVRRIF